MAIGRERSDASSAQSLFLQRTINSWVLARNSTCSQTALGGPKSDLLFAFSISPANGTALSFLVPGTLFGPILMPILVPGTLFCSKSSQTKCLAPSFRAFDLLAMRFSDGERFEKLIESEQLS